MTTTHTGTKTGERTDINSTEVNGERVNKNNETTAASSESIGSRDSTTRDLYSDTPQGALTGVENQTYLSNARKVTEDAATTERGNSTGVTQGEQTTNDKQNSNTTNVGKTNNTEDYVMHVFGKSAGANYSKMIKDFRDNLLNIDMDIIRDLADLFMLLW